MLEVTNANYVTDVESQVLPVLVDFYADWCGPCRMLKPILETLEAEFQGMVMFCKVNADDQMDICQKFGVRGLPTLALIVKGQETTKKVGLQSADGVRAWINETLATKQA